MGRKPRAFVCSRLQDRLGCWKFQPDQRFPRPDRMQLALMFVLCGLVISSTAAAEQTCKAKATEQRLAGAALLSFVKQCEVHAQMACAEAAHKMLAEPASESFIDTCRESNRGRAKMVRAKPLSRQLRLHGWNWL